MRQMKLYDLDDVFDFGKKHKEQFIRDVLYQDPIYLDWCVEQVNWFVLVDKVKVSCVEEMKKALRNSSNAIGECEELMEEALINNFESNCRKKKALYLLAEKRNKKLNARAADHDYYDDIDDNYTSFSRYNFSRDVLGGDPSAIWNID